MQNKSISADGIRLLENAKQWEDLNIQKGGDKRVIKFISKILFHGAAFAKPEDAVESVRDLFKAGYCYYFAKIMEDAFPGGVSCLCYPFGHIVYVYNGIAYDINGVSDAEHEHYIPISEFGKLIDEFRHIPDDLEHKQVDTVQSHVFSVYELEQELAGNNSEDKMKSIADKCIQEGKTIKAIDAYSVCK